MLHLAKGLLCLTLVPSWALIGAKVLPTDAPVDDIRAVPFGLENNKNRAWYPRADPQCDVNWDDDPDVPKCRILCAPTQSDCSNSLTTRNYRIRLNHTASDGINDDRDHVFTGLYDTEKTSHSKRAFQALTLAEIREYVEKQTDPDTADRYFGDLIGLVEFDDDNLSLDSSVAQQITFGNAPFQVGTTGLEGCTVVTVVSKRAVYMAHYWERKSWTSSYWFPRRIINFIAGRNPNQGVGPALNPALFNRPTDDTRIYIMHPRKGGKKATYTSPNYTKKFKQLRSLLNEELLPGVPTATWFYIPVANPGDVPDPIADQPWRRHAVFQYDPQAHGTRSKGWRLFYEDHYFDDTNPPPGTESANGIPDIP